MSTTAPRTVETTDTARVTVLDGVRGVALVLVVLSHLWHVSPWMLQRMYDADSGTGAAWSQLLGHLFAAGNFAVSIFFVVGAFLATRGLLRRAGAPETFRPSVPVLRRWVRLSGQMYAMLLVLVVVTALDSTKTYDETQTRGSVLAAATYTWNWFVHDNLATARPDIGHLWYLSVDFQVFLIVVAVVWFLRRRAALVPVVLGALWLAMLFWRTEIFADDPYGALLSTWARGDAPVAGALVASLLPWCRALVPYARALATGGAVALVPLLFLTHGEDGFFGWGGVALDLALGAFVLGCALAPPARELTATLGARPMAFLGRHSLGLYLWHFTVFTFVARHTDDWREPLRIGLALVATAVAVLLSEVLVERRVQRALDSPRWSELDDGVGPWLVRRARTAVRRPGARQD